MEVILIENKSCTNNETKQKNEAYNEHKKQIKFLRCVAFAHDITNWFGIISGTLNVFKMNCVCITFNRMLFGTRPKLHLYHWWIEHYCWILKITIIYTDRRIWLTINYTWFPIFKLLGCSQENVYFFHYYSVGWRSLQLYFVHFEANYRNCFSIQWN